MAIRKIAFLHQDTGTIISGDVIEHEGKLWLVPGWYKGPSKDTWRPARIICLHEMPVSKAGPQYPAVDLILSAPLSTEILDGLKASQSPLVIEQPEIILASRSLLF